MKRRKLFARSLEIRKRLSAENKRLKDEIAGLKAEIKDDGICGHWKNQGSAVTIRKSGPGYVATFFWEDHSCREAWILRKDRRLWLYESHDRCAGRVCHFQKIDLLALADYGFYIRDNLPTGLFLP